MPDYRVEGWFTYWQSDTEDELEEQFREFMKQSRMHCKGGPIVFRVYPS